MGVPDDSLSKKLFNEQPEKQSYPANEKAQAHLLEQYKLYVEMMDRGSGRRLTANTYFLSVNTALLGFVTYIAKDAAGYLWILGLAGMALCWLWHCIIESHKNLNTAKFAVIHLIERRLPMNPYAAEWAAAGEGKDSSRYLPFTHIETGVPLIFGALHAIVFVRALPWEIFRRWFCVG